jgi:aldehyde:ferredoxin oxidoreductase
MPYGWTGKILRVDLTRARTSTVDTMKYAHEYIGGRGIAARIAWEEIRPGTTPYAPENKLIITTGPLTGTLAPTSGRTIFGSISPRLYPNHWYTHSTMGGWFGPQLKYAGFDGIVVEGKAQAPVYLWVNDDEVEIRDASDLWGTGARSTESLLKDIHGKKAQIISIGPAGENLVRFATITMLPEAASGHSGFGAVMGSKKLKAIAVRGTGSVGIAEPSEFLDECRYVMTLYRRALIMSFLWWDYPKEKSALADRPICTPPCTACCDLGVSWKDVPRRIGSGLIKCETGFCVGPVILSEIKYTEYEGGDVRVPPGKPFDLPEGVELHALCDDLGLDLWSFQVIQPFLIACMRNGVPELCGEKLNPEDPRWLYELFHRIAHRKGELPNMLAEDLRRAGENLRPYLTKDLLRLVEALEFDFGFPAHREGRLWDPEPSPFWIVSMLMHVGENRDPTIGAHSSYLFFTYFMLDDKEAFSKKFRPLAKRIWGSEDAAEPGYEHKPRVALWCIKRHMIIDSLPMCDMAFPRTVRSFDTKNDYLDADDIYGDLDLESRLFSKCTGVEMSTSDLEKAGERVFSLERAIAVRFGRTRSVDELLEPHFELPCRTDGTKLDWKTFCKALDEFYATAGWESSNGIPTRAKLEELDLEDVAEDLERRGLTRG